MHKGDWLPNEFGGDANLQAISLLQELNWVVHREFPGVFTIAEESTAWPGVTDKDRGRLLVDSFSVAFPFTLFIKKKVTLVHSLSLSL